jgi:hypothetical protein
MALLQSSPLPVASLIHNKIWGLYCVGAGQQVFWGCVAAFSGRKFGRCATLPGWMRTARALGGRAGGGIWRDSAANFPAGDNGAIQPFIAPRNASAARPVPHGDSRARTNAAFLGSCRLIDNLTRGLRCSLLCSLWRLAGADQTAPPGPPFAARFSVYAGRARAVQDFEKKRIPKNQKAGIPTLLSICCYSGAGFRDRDKMGSGGKIDIIRENTALNCAIVRQNSKNAADRVGVHSAFANWLDKRTRKLGADFSYVN